MAIEKNSFKLLSTEFSAQSRETIMSSDDEDIRQHRSVAVGSDDDDFEDCDSGVGSDDFDLLELGDDGEEFCQVGDQTCSISYDLYDLPGLQDVLSLDVWNEVLTEEERFTLAQYLPDMDKEMFLQTLKEIFTGSNLHFGNPVDKFYEMLKGGLCEPRVALYRQGLNFFQKRQHYHMLKKHQNSMITSLCHMRDAWSSCKGYSAEKKLQILNIMKSMMNGKIEELESDSSGRESGDVLWGKRIKDWKLEQRMGSHGTNSSMDIHIQNTKLESAAKQTMKGLHSIQSKRAGYNHGTAIRMKDLIGGNEEEVEELFPVSVKKHQNLRREWILEQRMGSHGTNSSMDIHSKKTTLESATKQTMKGLHSRQNERAGYNHGAAFQMKDQIVGNEEVEELFPVTVKNLDREWKLEQRMGSYGTNSSMDIRSKKMTLDSAAKQAIKGLHSRQNKRDRYNHGVAVQMKDHIVGNEVDSEELFPFFLGRAQRESYTAEAPHEYDAMNMKTKKGKTGRMPADVNDRLFPIEYQSQPLLEKFRGSFAQNGEQGMDRIRGTYSFSRNDETESDSSEQIEENVDDNPLMRRKCSYGSSISDKKAGFDYKTKISKKDEQSNFRGYDGSSNNSKKTDDYGVHIGIRNLGNYGTRVESKGEMHDVRFLNSLSSGNFDAHSRFGSGRLSGDDDWRQMSRLGRDGYMQGDYDMVPFKESRGNIMHEYIDPRSNRILYSLEGEYNLHPESSGRDSIIGVRMGKKVQVVESLVDNRFEMADAQLIGCKSTKKRKVKPDFTYMDEQRDKDNHSDKHLHLLDSDISRRRGKKELGIGNETLEKEIVELPVTDLGVGDSELDTKPQKKPFILITPTVHTGFSFSIIHLLSSVRMTMITLLPEDSPDASSHQAKIDGQSVEKQITDLTTGVTSEVGAPADEKSASNPAPFSPDNVPFLAVEEIVNRVKSNPGDPCILETQEPLQDLVRGVLKILSSKTAPLGAKGWKPLVLYEKTRKSWTWNRPVNQNPADEDVEEVTSPEAWGLPHKLLVKLVDAFANWLKNGQETLQQIGSLPAPPLSLMQYTLEEKERFKDLRAQKSLSTISPSSEEVRSYFRKEEVLRYSIPDRAFSYIANDGKESVVAPLRRCGGKPTSKARDHFMLKRDRPPHVTILCLVRDAAARLPGSIGTRADVCTLIRDSQYIVEDVTDVQVNQVVSGAMDRLHYERDPCVQFDGDRKLWVYLHREREEEDFEDDGTSSTKKWKRQKKETTVAEQGVTVAYSAPIEQSQLDPSSDPNVKTQQMDEDKGPQLTSHDDGKDHMQDESKLLCQENSINDDFDDEPSRIDQQ